MATQRRLASRTLLALGTAAALSNCDILLPCTDELRPSVVVEVRDPVTGMPAARGVTGRSEHESGVLTEFSATGDLRLDGDWNSELPGSHAILVRKPGFLTDSVHVDVGVDRCHVEPRTVQAHIVPDPRAVPEHPVSFIEGPDIDARQPYPASAEVRVYGDTLEIGGLAHTECTELRVVAFRSGTRLHVQIEPSGIPLDSCTISRRFQAKFTLPSERTHLLVTNGFLFPAELFDGQVRPVEEG